MQAASVAVNQPKILPPMMMNGVINAGENEAAGVESMKFFEVGPNLIMTEHAITIRPLCFSSKTFKTLPPELQAAVVKAGREAGAHGRQIESSEDSAKLDAFFAACAGYARSVVHAASSVSASLHPPGILRRAG